MACLRIKITDPETVQLLMMYTRDVQNALAEKAVADFFEKNGAREIVKVLHEKGIKLEKQLRKRVGNGGTDQNDARNKHDAQHEKRPSAAAKIGIFNPV